MNGYLQSPHILAIMRLTRHWHRFCRDVDVPCVEVFKTRLDGALRNLISCKMSLLMAWQWDWMR